MELFWCAYFFLANLIGSPAGAGRPNLGRVESLPCLFVGIPIVHHTWDTGGGGVVERCISEHIVKYIPTTRDIDWVTRGEGKGYG